MKKWEYLCCNYNINGIDNISLDDIFNTLGAQGWELVVVFNKNRIIFKREKIEIQKPDIGD